MGSKKHEWVGKQGGQIYMTCSIPWRQEADGEDKQNPQMAPLLSLYRACPEIHVFHPFLLWEHSSSNSSPPNSAEIQHLAEEQSFPEHGLFLFCMSLIRMNVGIYSHGPHVHTPVLPTILIQSRGIYQGCTPSSVLEAHLPTQFTQNFVPCRALQWPSLHPAPAFQPPLQRQNSEAATSAHHGLLLLVANQLEALILMDSFGQLGT